VKYKLEIPVDFPLFEKKKPHSALSHESDHKERLTRDSILTSQQMVEWWLVDVCA
jgi:hypothetical protein